MEVGSQWSSNPRISLTSRVFGWNKDQRHEKLLLTTTSYLGTMDERTPPDDPDQTTYPDSC